METEALIAFLKKAVTDEGLRRDLVTLAERHGIRLELNELTEEAMAAVAAGVSAPKLAGRSPGGDMSSAMAGGVLDTDNLHQVRRWK